MKLFILGGTGRTGRRLVELALARGHDVTALVRVAGKIPPTERLRIVAGNPTRAEEWASALAGQDVIISCLGQRSKADARLLQEAAAATLGAMERAGVRRYLVVSQGLLFPNRSPIIGLLRWLLARTVADSTAMEQLVRASGTDWTIVRAPRLADGDTKRGYKIEVGARPPGMAMQRGDLATFLLDEAEQAAHVREIIGITSAWGV